MKNLIISTKLSTLRSAELISTCHLNSDERSKRTFVDCMDIVRQCNMFPPVLMVVPDDVAREFPIVPCICEARPIYVNFALTAGQTTTPTSISGHDPRTHEYVIFTL